MGMTYYEAAIHILRSAQRPLTTREIAERAIDTGLIKPHGKTPDATMSAALYGHLRDDVRLTKLEASGNGRAKRGSVRWVLRDADSSS
jgi:HB1, ASXL, restriction endonuclease HTH domain